CTTSSGSSDSYVCHRRGNKRAPFRIHSCACLVLQHFPDCHEIARCGHVMDAEDLDRVLSEYIRRGGERAGQALLYRSVEQLAEEALARHAEADRPAEPGEIREPAQDRDVVLARLAEADARIERKRIRRDPELGQRL